MRGITMTRIRQGNSTFHNPASPLFLAISNNLKLLITLFNLADQNNAQNAENARYVTVHTVIEQRKKDGRMSNVSIASLYASSPPAALLASCMARLDNRRCLPWLVGRVLEPWARLGCWQPRRLLLQHAVGSPLV